jgi:hypothetical protein
MMEQSWIPSDEISQMSKHEKLIWEEGVDHKKQEI